MSDPLTILHGDVLAMLATLEDESIHCVVTSPPYWGLRDYKIPPSIWGGRADCEHEWGDASRARRMPPRPDHSGSKMLGIRGEQAGANAFGLGVERGNFCQHCDAWRGCHGLEPTLELYVAHEVMIFREVRRVLRHDGTLWLNLGDSYASAGGHSDKACNERRGEIGIGTRPEHEHRAFRARARSKDGGDCDPKRSNGSTEGQHYRHCADASLKPKDLCGVPWRVALALQAEGWYLRCDIIWHKPNPMPESTTDRPTKAHEYIFLLTKSERYFYDAEAIKEPTTGNAHARGDGVNPKAKLPGENSRVHVTRAANGAPPKARQNESFSAAVVGLVDSRNKRSVWTVPTSPYSGAHFATFPPDLIKPCILAGTSAKGCCPQCGAPWERITKPTEEYAKHLGKSYHSHDADLQAGLSQAKREGFKSVNAQYITTGWEQGCQCVSAIMGQTLEPIACTVLDPFGGSGTTAEVSLELHRKAILIEIGEHHLPLIHQRTAHGPGLALH